MWNRNLGVGIFATLGMGLFAVIIFLIGNQHSAFAKHIELSRDDDASGNGEHNENRGDDRHPPKLTRAVEQRDQISESVD